MSKKILNKRFGAILAGASIFAMAAAPALAQPAAQTEDEADEEEIVVTGTQIRGVAATGSQTIALDAEAIAEVGAFNTNELLAAIPQMGTFNGRFEQDPRGAFQDSVNRPNLRNLPGFNSASGSVTLLIVDGHRLTPVGVGEATVDADIIPAAVLQRVEVVTDGGSSIYGADAVAGVINFISRKSFDGVQVDANYGFGDTIDGFSEYDGALTMGTDWGSGNGYISVGHSDREAITNGETSWARQGTWTSSTTLNTNIGTQCVTPQNTVQRFVWIPSFGVWTDNPLAGGGPRALGTGCNIYAEDAYLAAQQRDNFFGSLTQELASNMELHVTGYYTSREVNMPLYSQGGSRSIPVVAPTTPGTAAGQIVDVPSGTSFAFSPNPAYVDRDFIQTFDTWGISPELTLDLGGDWQVRGTLHVGRSENASFNPTVNGTALATAITGGALDPNNVAAASAATIQGILDLVDAAETNHDLADLRVIADGPLFNLPAGPLRVAIGAEFANSKAETRGGGGTYASFYNRTFNSAERDQISAFAEANVPVFDALDLSFAIRYDDYSDFGDTTNPTLGFDLHPVDGLRIFGHWGKSFNAPTLLDTFGPLISTGRMIQGLGAGPVLNQDSLDGDVDWDGVGTDILQGTGAAGDIAPQTAEQWALGGEFEPADGWRFGFNYYEINFVDILGAVNPQDPVQVRLFPDKFIWNPTQAQWDAYLLRVNNAASLPASPTNISFILDRITSNLSFATLTGLDFSASYTRDTSFGTFDIGISGNHQLSATQNSVDILANNVPDLTMIGTLGWQGEHLRSRLSVNHTGGFTTNSTGGRQARVDSYTTADLHVGYDLGAFGAEGSSLRFGINNLFEAEPPVWKQNSSSLAWQGYSLGRVVRVGVSAHF